MGLYDRLNRPVLAGRRVPAARWRIIATAIAVFIIGGALLFFLAPPPLCSDAAPISGHSPEGAYHVYFEPGRDTREFMERARQHYGVETVIGRPSMQRVSVVATRRQITRLRCDAAVVRIESL
jgi:hypothetical protein